MPLSPVGFLLAQPCFLGMHGQWQWLPDPGPSAVAPGYEGSHGPACTLCTFEKHTGNSLLSSWRTGPPGRGVSKPTWPRLPALFLSLAVFVLLGRQLPSPAEGPWTALAACLREAVAAGQLCSLACSTADRTTGMACNFAKGSRRPFPLLQCPPASCDSPHLTHENTEVSGRSRN